MTKEDYELVRRNFKRTQDLLNAARNWRFVTKEARDQVRVQAVTERLEKTIDEL
jgi:hypothetical protein